MAEGHGAPALPRRLLGTPTLRPGRRPRPRRRRVPPKAEARSRALGARSARIQRRPRSPELRGGARSGRAFPAAPPGGFAQARIRRDPDAGSGRPAPPPGAASAWIRACARSSSTGPRMRAPAPRGRKRGAPAGAPAGGPAAGPSHRGAAAASRRGIGKLDGNAGKRGAGVAGARRQPAPARGGKRAAGGGSRAGRPLARKRVGRSGFAPAGRGYRPRARRPATCTSRRAPCGARRTFATCP